MFSRRAGWSLESSEFSLLLDAQRKSGRNILDLTESNPTRAGFEYPERLLDALRNPKALLYEPSPLGLPSAREAVAAEHGVSLEQVLVTASSSESYSYLFKLLCDPGDEVLIPQPSYPLFEFLAGLECVEQRPYSIRYDGRWRIDMASLESAITARTRAILVVNPNNPTGSYIRPDEVTELRRICRAHSLALISDEVFFDYAFERRDFESWAAVAEHSIVFQLGGLSKSAGLPQLKAGWMIVQGPARQCKEAMERLEMIADTYLSVSTPIQLALPALLEEGRKMQRQIKERTSRNLGLLQSVLTPFSVEGGWYAILPLPDDVDDGEFTLTLLRDHDILAQPGFFYDFEHGNFLVLSLLSREREFAAGTRVISDLLRAGGIAQALPNQSQAART
ncbi:MAG: pyridoxal phosphate-dependent aminotransferase [Candidatus Solibacter usitatus]|nr:pyridoxal phosphate-dependent aminotransferase [Candidatus Solibacter usitatus]